MSKKKENVRSSKLDEIEVVIAPEVYQKVMYWVNKSRIEISGFGKVEFNGTQLLVTQAYLLDQENTAASTDINADAMAKLMFESKDDAGHLNWWWHSHVNMDVFWSGTDRSTIRQVGEQGWCLATVFNKKNEMRSAYYQKGDGFLPEVFIDELETDSRAIVASDAVTAWEEEFKKKCKAKQFPSWKGGKQGKSGKQHGKNGQAKKRGTTVLGTTNYRGGTNGNLRENLPTTMEVFCLEDSERRQWWKLYQDFFGYEPETTMEFERFYQEWKDMSIQQLTGENHAGYEI